MILNTLYSSETQYCTRPYDCCVAFTSWFLKMWLFPYPYGFCNPVQIYWRKINDMIWYDMIWYDMIWYDMIWYMIWYDIYYMICYDMIWYDMIYGMICYDMLYAWLKYKNCLIMQCILNSLHIWCTGWRAHSSNPRRGKNFPFSKTVQTGSGAQPASKF